ncbi:hypothetical protein IFVP69_C2170193 [Vibrio parahaemolyticus]
MKKFSENAQSLSYRFIFKFILKMFLIEIGFSLYLMRLCCYTA